MIDVLAGREREIALVVRRRAAKFAARGVADDHVALSSRNIAGEIGATLNRRTFHAVSEDVQLVGKRRRGAKQETAPAPADCPRACPTREPATTHRRPRAPWEPMPSRGELPAGPVAARQRRFRSPNLRSRRPEHGREKSLGQHDKRLAGQHAAPRRQQGAAGQWPIDPAANPLGKDHPRRSLQTAQRNR